MLLLILIGYDSSYTWRVEKYNQYMQYEKNKGLIIGVLTILIYGIISRFILNDQKSFFKNMLSVSGLFVILLFCNLTNQFYYLNSNYILKGAYSQFVGYKLQLAIVILPSLVMGLAINHKMVCNLKCNNKKRA